MKSVSTIIDVNMLEAGIYFLNLYQEGNRLSFKFIKN
ncbi:MAG: T9SS type A sorting domain-containing protein [Bacteroidales bacterium]|nr:T9SS type A sorting domain-containing protein [Bacteroidales bacterium]